MHGARRATRSELPELNRLLHSAIEATPPRRGGDLFGFPARARAVEVRLSEALESDDIGLFVGTIDDVVVGFALVSRDGGTATVEELHVEPPAREVGVGEALLNACVEWASAVGAAAVDYPALPGDRATKNLGERSGFVARLIVMHRRL